MESYRANNLKIYDTDNTTLRKEIYNTGFQNYEFDDILPSGDWIGAAGAAAPDDVTATIAGVDFRYKAFDGITTEEAISNSFEITHAIDLEVLNNETVKAEIHTHGLASTTGSGNVIIFFDLVYLPLNSAPISLGTYQTTVSISANQQYYHKIAGVEITKPSSNYNIGDKLKVRYRRTPTNAGDTYTGDWLFEQCALHMPINSNGSRQRYVK